MASRPTCRYQRTPSEKKQMAITTPTPPPFDGRSSASSEQSERRMCSASPRHPNHSSVKRLVNNLTSTSTNRYSSSSPSSSSSKDKGMSSKKEHPPPTSKTSSAIVKSKSSSVSPKPTTNMTTLVKKFMDHKGKGKPLSATGNTTLVIPADFIAEDLKVVSSKANKLKNLHEKLLHRMAGKSSGSRPQKKTLIDSKTTRPLSVVLKSEQELLQQNREFHIQVEELSTMLAAKNAEVDELRSLGIMLKELCSKQQNEIKALKSSFPASRKDSSQLHQLLEKQGAELKQARLVIPNLQEQVTCLTAQLKSLAEGLAEVKADKEAMRAYFDGHITTPQTAESSKKAEDSKEFCTSDPSSPVRQEDMMLTDMNPCLTPYYARTKSMELEVIGYGLTDEEQLAEALHKLVIGTKQKQDVLQEHCINVLRKSVSCSPLPRRLSSGKKISTADENRLGLAHIHDKAPHQKLCWD